MSTLEIARSTLSTSLRRYTRSRGLWLLLLTAPIAGRTLVDGSWVHVSIEGHLPVLTPATLGATLGIIVATIVWPIAAIYLRSNATRRQPWQVEEVTAAPRVAITLGRFAADVAVLWTALGILSVASLFLGSRLIEGPLEPLILLPTLWWIAAPALMLIAAQNALLDAMPATRGAFGEVVAFLTWMAVLTLPAATLGLPSSLIANMADPGGYVRPLAGHAFAVGGTRILPGRIPLDVTAQIEADGYRGSRLIWGLIAVGMAALAGLLYRPHRNRRLSAATGRRLNFLRFRRRPLAAVPDAPRAAPARVPLLNLVWGEIVVISSGALFKPLALLSAVIGLFGDFRHFGSPIELLLLSFALAAEAGRSESKGMANLLATMRWGPFARRAAFICGGVAWGVMLALPAAIVRQSAEPLMLGLITAASASFVATVTASASRSAFAPRILLLAGWYVYFAT